MTSTIEVSCSENNYFALLEGLKLTPRKPTHIWVNPTLLEIQTSWPKGELLAVDFETKGTDFTHPDFELVGLGVAGESGSIYVHLKDLFTEVEQWIKSELLKSKLTAFNVTFDGACLYWWTGEWANFVGDSYGAFRQLATEGWPGQRWSLDEAIHRLLGWPHSQKDDVADWLVANGHGSVGHPDKSKLYLVPADILGPYCALDAEAAWQLWTIFFPPYFARFEALATYHEHLFMNLVKLIVEQQGQGIAIDVPQLTAYANKLTEQIEQSRAAFTLHSQISPWVKKWQTNLIKELESKEPNKFLKEKKKGATPKLSKNWIKWQEKLETLKGRQDFNLDSDQQLRWLFYDCLRYPVRLKTEGGQPAISGKVLPAFGEPGKILINYNEMVKELSYVKGCLDNVREGELYLQLKSVGTLTGRCAGSGGINLQQIPHSEGYMKCWTARPGHVWVDFDFSALEPTVLAELSEDPTMMKLYGPSASPYQDIYLFNACHMPGLKEKVRKFYNPEIPTEASVKQAKKECKHERTISKVITLASSYGAGTGKLYEVLTLDGINITWDQVDEIRNSYWKLYKGVKEYEAKLLAEWEENNGWVYNGLQRPLSISPDLMRDCLNRVIQSTGHDLLMMFLFFLDQVRQERHLDFKFVVADFHDQTIVECKEDLGLKVQEAFVEALHLTNEEISGTIKLRGKPQVVRNLWQAKGD